MAFLCFHTVVCLFKFYRCTLKLETLLWRPRSSWWGSDSAGPWTRLLWCHQWVYEEGLKQHTHTHRVITHLHVFTITSAGGNKKCETHATLRCWPGSQSVHIVPPWQQSFSADTQSHQFLLNKEPVTNKAADTGSISPSRASTRS